MGRRDAVGFEGTSLQGRRRDPWARRDAAARPDADDYPHRTKSVRFLFLGFWGVGLGLCSLLFNDWFGETIREEATSISRLWRSMPSIPVSFTTTFTLASPLKQRYSSACNCVWLCPIFFARGLHERNRQLRARLACDSVATVLQGLASAFAFHFFLGSTNPIRAMCDD